MPSPRTQCLVQTLGQLGWCWRRAGARLAAATGVAGARLAALGVVAWHYWRCAVLLRLTARQRVEPPQGDGVWNELDRLSASRPVEMRDASARCWTCCAPTAPPPSLPDAVVVVERNSQRVLWFNERATSLLGLRYPRDIDAHRRTPAAAAGGALAGAGRNAEPLESARRSIRTCAAACA
jgi:two-component system phosphate regulon sensor histidine kinase PhoR